MDGNRKATVRVEWEGRLGGGWWGGDGWVVGMGGEWGGGGRGMGRGGEVMGEYGDGEIISLPLHLSFGYQ